MTKGCLTAFFCPLGMVPTAQKVYDLWEPHYKQLDENYFVQRMIVRSGPLRRLPDAGLYALMNIATMPRSTAPAVARRDEAIGALSSDTRPSALNCPNCSLSNRLKKHRGAQFVTLLC